MSTETTPPNRLYFAAWRWHFYAGLYTIPFMLMLAVTGLIMLWVSAMTELNGERAHITPGTAPLPVSQLQAAAEAAVPGSAATQYISPMGADRVAAFAVALGFDRRFQLNLPGDETGVWTISHDSMSNDGPKPGADRTLHIDQYTGNVLADVRYADYSPYAKMMVWGIAFHEGDLGAWNLALNTVFCLALIFVSVSGLVMWWKRRPAGQTRLGAPPRPTEIPYGKGALLIVLALSLAFPMLGLALLAVILLDLLILTTIPPLKRLVS